MKTLALHQLVHTLSYGDAISGEVIALRRCLHALGFESEIYAINVNPRYKAVARDYRDYPAAEDGGVILHYSLGSPLNQLYCSLERQRRVLIYHNLTPAHWFRSVNPIIVQNVESGLKELPQLCVVSSMRLADSTFNAQELEVLGFSAEVLPLPIDPARWDVVPNAGISSLITSDPSLHVLHVGRMAPNKRIEDIIKAFYFLNRHIRRQSKLWLVGIDIDTEVYSFGLKQLSHHLGLGEFVRFVGCRDDGELRAFYENCSLYMCMSEHEGFCLPLIEAMHFGLPVIAYAAGAVPETVGKGGIIVAEKDPPFLAELIEELFSDTVMRDKVIAAGRARATELSFESFEKRIHDLFARPGDERMVVPPNCRAAGGRGATQLCVGREYKERV